MKRFSRILILAGALSAPTVAYAQPYNAAHQIKASEAKGLDWTIFDGPQKESDIKALQFLLRNRGFYRAEVDGKFGELTKKAVRDFQRSKGLKVDGRVGSQTWPLLLLRLKQGDRGDAVRAWQIALRDYAAPDGTSPFAGQKVDGIFGSATRANVTKFQKYWGELKVDGIVGAHTWEAILQPDLS